MPPLTTPLRPATDDHLDRAVAAGVGRGQLPLVGYGVALLAACAALALMSGPLALGVGAAALTLLALFATAQRLVALALVTEAVTLVGGTDAATARAVARGVARHGCYPWTGVRTRGRVLALLAAQSAPCAAGHGPLCPHRLPRQRGEDAHA